MQAKLLSSKHLDPGKPLSLLSWLLLESSTCLQGARVQQLPFPCCSATSQPASAARSCWVLTAATYVRLQELEHEECLQVRFAGRALAPARSLLAAPQREHSPTGARPCWVRPLCKEPHGPGAQRLPNRGPRAPGSPD